MAERKVSLSVKQAQIKEEKSLVKKFGKDAKSSGATLADIFNKALNITKKKITRKRKLRILVKSEIVKILKKIIRN